MSCYLRKKRITLQMKTETTVPILNKASAVTTAIIFQCDQLGSRLASLFIFEVHQLKGL